MTAIPYNRRSSAFPLLFILALIVGLGIMYSATHAVERHGAAAVDTIECSEGSDNLLQKWTKPDGRDIYVCDVKGQFGIVVEANGDLITAFVKDKFTRLEQVMRYLTNCGANQVW